MVIAQWENEKKARTTMQTKYDANQHVLLRAKVHSIRIEPNEEPIYFVEVAGYDPYNPTYEHITAKESEIVCGWIGGDTND